METKNINLVRSSKFVCIEVTCPNKFDENDLACFWCRYSDECREDCKDEDIKDQAE